MALLDFLPVVGGVLDFLGGGSTNRANSRSVHETNETNKYIAERQNGWNYKMWQLNNEYNSPVNQMARLRAAGLNPNLVYGNGSVVGNSASQAHPAAGYTAQAFTGNRNVLSGFSSAMREISMNIAQRRLIDAQRENTEANTARTRIQAIGDSLSNHSSEFDYFLKRQLRNNTIKLALGEYDKQKAEINELNTRSSLNESRKYLSDSQYSRNLADIHNSSLITESKLSEARQRILESKARITDLIASSSLKAELKYQAIEQANKLHQEIENLKIAYDNAKKQGKKLDEETRSIYEQRIIKRYLNYRKIVAGDYPLLTSSRAIIDDALSFGGVGDRYWEDITKDY